MEHCEYWDEIVELAQAATAHAREAAAEGEDPHAAAAEWLHETIDGHQYVTYTHHAMDVLRHSDNDGIGLSDGLVQVPPGGPIPWSALAYCAMEADIREHSAFAIDGIGEDDDDDDA